MPNGDEPQLGGQQGDDNSPGLPRLYRQIEEQEYHGWLRLLAISYMAEGRTDREFINLYLGVYHSNWQYYFDHVLRRLNDAGVRYAPAQLRVFQDIEQLYAVHRQTRDVLINSSAVKWFMVRLEIPEALSEHVARLSADPYQDPLAQAFMTAMEIWLCSNKPLEEVEISRLWSRI